MEIPPGFDLAAHIDHTLLTPSAGIDQILAAARLAREAGFAAFCHPPFALPAVAAELKGSRTAAQTVVGFPLGFQSLEVKVFEARAYVSAGATELDMVVNRSFIRSGAIGRVEEEIGLVTAAAGGVGVKAILEISDLSDEEILAGCDAAIRAGASFVKTSTGFFGHGAVVEAVRMIKDYVGDRIRIKAAGGIRDLETALAFIRAGADRIGTSSGDKISASFGIGGGDRGR